MRSLRLPKWAAAAGLVVLLLGAAVFGQSASGRSLLGDAGLVSAPDRFSELYFDRPTRLPKTMPAGQTTTLPFRIGNREGRELSYRWTLSARTESGAVTRVAGGERRVRSYGQELVRPRVRLSCRAGERVRLSVLLQPPRHQISHLTRCQGVAP